MIIKFKSIIVIIIIFLSVLIVGQNFDLRAKSLDNEMSSLRSSRSNNYQKNSNFNWDEIEVISEPIIGVNINIVSSESPKIAVENDKIYVVWFDGNNTNGSGTDTDIFYRYFDGSKWSKIQVISEPIPGQNLNTRDSLSPSIDVENGKIYVVWHDNTLINNSGGDYDIFYRCNLTGNGWEDIQVISEPIQGQMSNIYPSTYPEIIVENGKIYVVWQDRNDTNGAGHYDADIFYRCNITGINWEDIQVISEPIINQDFNIGESSEPALSVENSKIYVMWQDINDTNGAGEDSDIFYRCNLTGSSWGDIQVISEPLMGSDINIGGSSHPSIAVENGKIYAVWSDGNNTNSAGGDSDIFYRYFDGSKWSKIQVISEPILGQNNNIGLSNNPVITVENGKIYVVWDDNDNLIGSGSDKDIFWRSNQTGSYWEDIQVISELIKNNNFNTEASIRPDIAVNLGKSYIVWEDSNNTDDSGSDTDIFYMGIKDQSPLFLNFPKVTPTLGNTSTNFIFTVTYFHLNNTNPLDITVYISESKHSMSEVDPIDNNYQNGKDYYFTITNLNIGSHLYQFYASDGKFTRYTALMNMPEVYNSPPNIITGDNNTAFEDSYYEVDYKYEDIDVKNVGQPGFWNFSTNASWLKFDEITAILNGTPMNDDVGEYWVNIIISDTIDHDYTNFTLTVINTNDPPIIVTKDKINAKVGELYSVNYAAEDIDPLPTTLIWSVKSNTSDWLTIDETEGWLIGIPSENDVGAYWVNISVTDSENGLDYHNFTLHVQKGQINKNNAPELINPTLSPSKGNIETEFTFSVQYFDADNDTPIFIRVLIDNKSNNMTLKSGENAVNDIYEYKTKLSEGKHSYYFRTSDGLETIKTDNFLTPYIKKVDDNTDKESDSKGNDKLSWHWLIGIVIIMITIVLIIIFLIIRVKKKMRKNEQLHTLKVQNQTAIGAPSEKRPVASLALSPALATPLQSQEQLPLVTITKTQQLNLLRERFLRGEVTEETYKELKAEIKGSTQEEVTKEALKK